MREKQIEEPQDENHLLESIRNGEASAFEALYVRYYPAFKTYVLGQSGNEQDARDIFQEAMYTGWLKVRTGKYVNNGTSKFSTFLFEIAKRKWWNLSKSSHMKKVVHTDDVRILDQNVEALIEGDEKDFKIELLNKIIGTLDKNCQEILRQFYFSHMSYDDMAIQLGKTAKTLKNQKFRCIGRLREKYLEALKNDSFE